MTIKVWVGKRESDILTYKYFDMSITFWGSNINNNYSFCTTERKKDNYDTNFKEFVLEKLNKIINKSADVEIHFYNNSFAYKIILANPTLKKYIVNLNNQKVFDIVRHKTLSRLWLQNIVKVPKFTYISKKDCQYCSLVNKFPQYKRFVIQKSISGGGEGTYLIDSENWQKVFDILENNDIYLVSPYYENNISLSCHLIIASKQIIVFPISRQLLNYNNNKIAYCGNQYLDSTNSISYIIKKMAATIGYELASLNYKGICGLDFILADNEPMLIEINPRYQGSSYVLNAELKKLALPSLFELNNMAFSDCISKELTSKIENMNISYESHVYTYQKGWSHSRINCPVNATLFLDGVSNASTFADDVYLYRYLI